MAQHRRRTALPALAAAVSAVALAVTACTGSGGSAVSSSTTAVTGTTASPAGAASTVTSPVASTASSAGATIASTAAAGSSGASTPATSGASSGGSAGGSTTATAPSTLDTRYPPAVADQEVSDAQVDAAIGQVDGLATAVMRRSGIPGMAVAVVHHGTVAFAKGYGVRKEGSPGAVDADTVFQLASVSKAIGATVVAHEVTEKTVDWSTPVSKYLHDFRLSDPWVTSHVTVGDMYAHRSGLPAHAGDLLEDLGYSQSDIFRRLGVLPLQPFRSTYAYTNFGLTAGAEAVAAAAGTSWPDLSQRVLYQPLGMTSTSSRFADYAARPNRAWTHVQVGGRWQPKIVRDADQQTPAGGVSSSVNDLAKWLAMILGDGTGSGGVKIASPDALDPALSAQIVASPAPPQDRAGFYGFGFDVAYQSSGRVEIAHSGAFSAGAGTNFVLLPSLDVGIVTLTNASPIGVAEALNQQFADLVQYGAQRFDWYGLYSQALGGLGAPFGRYAGKQPPANARPAADLSRYVGTYANGWVGPVQVRRAGSGLELVIGPRKQTYRLTHWDGDVWTYQPSGESANPGSVSAVTFARSGQGAATSMDIEFYEQDGEGVLRRT
ncbi:serine hydrolase [Nakamurella endophytica]|uniref:Serine hydrolase n=1 Tax=Nakamurella endophytica TaxID=1748367 RepID=A0A917SWN6_9ACTN|nr:serine hydrolase [Nakamurella endophytica]GGL99883.1 hypothetical protein GCM10011594_19840 [Nakamurella endophytica]